MLYLNFYVIIILNGTSHSHTWWIRFVVLYSVTLPFGYKMAFRIRVLSFLVIIINAMQSLGQAPNATAKEIGKFYLILNGVSLAKK